MCFYYLWFTTVSQRQIKTLRRTSIIWRFRPDLETPKTSVVSPYYYYFRGPSSGQCHDFGGRQNSLTARSSGSRAVNGYWQPATLGNHLTSNVGRDRRQLIRWYHSMQWILHWRQMPTNQLTSLEAEFDVNAPCIRPRQVDFLINRIHFILKIKKSQCGAILFIFWNYEVEQQILCHTLKSNLSNLQPIQWWILMM